MGQAFITRRGGGGYSEGDVIPSAGLQPIYPPLDFTKTFVTNTYSPNTTTTWDGILDTFILSNGVTILQITTTAFNLFKVSEPLTLIATATHDEYNDYYYRSDDGQKITIDEASNQFYTLYNGYVHAYSLITLEEQWSVQYVSSGWSASDKESICIDPTDHSLWYIGIISSSKKLVHHNPTTGSVIQTYTVTSAYNAVEKSCIYNGVIYGTARGSSDLYYASWNLSTGANITAGSQYVRSINNLKEWFLYQNHLFCVYYGSSDFAGYRINIAASSSSNSVDVKYTTYISADTRDSNSEYYYHPVGVTSDGNLFLILGPIRYEDTTDSHRYAADLGAGCGTLAKTMSFSGTSAATQVSIRSIGSVWNYNYRTPIKGPNYPVIGSEGFCYYPDTNDSTIAQITNLPTGYKVLNEN